MYFDKVEGRLVNLQFGVRIMGVHRYFIYHNQHNKFKKREKMRSFFDDFSLFFFASSLNSVCI